MTFSWKHKYDNMGDRLAPSMAKDHPNLPVVKEEGCYYYGADGKTYLDFTSGIATTNVGHRHPKVVDAIKRGADHLAHGPSGVIMYDSILTLADRLADVMPGEIDCFFFSNSGTEAIEGAMKLARHVTERPYIVSFTGCFHGRSQGAMSVSTSKAKYRKFQPHTGTFQVPFADSSSCPEGADPEAYVIDKLEHDFDQLLKHQVTADEVAAVILEPVLGEGGYIIPPASWLKKVREICDRYGFLLIFDEVQTGFGRTGEMFAAQTFGVEPDIMAIAKGIANGMPLSATAAPKALMEKWPMGSHGTTFGGNPIACEAALAVLDVIEEEHLLENSRTLGSYAKKRLEEIKESHSCIGKIRGEGLMIGIEIVDPETGLPDGDAMFSILDTALENGVLFYFCGNASEVIRMIPPLTVTKEQIDEGLDMLEKALSVHEESQTKASV
ncbi:aspartate aminotransferase family protein [Alteribacter natronophilus]|uniref:aspartate aminotransferase family protein n=1 Tax=Alteribacter natronophilus TaxID=2583810 RepID=UPI00110DB08D|nr:aspartate aminotransferase family protein [Alteribacter natronophilus]TMW70720.1 aspartate aminotransferase family protein [Alteribacter natronophilus]